MFRVLLLCLFVMFGSIVGSQAQSSNFDVDAVFGAGTTGVYVEGYCDFVSGAPDQSSWIYAMGISLISQAPISSV